MSFGKANFDIMEKKKALRPKAERGNAVASEMSDISHQIAHSNKTYQFPYDLDNSEPLIYVSKGRLACLGHAHQI